MSFISLDFAVFLPLVFILYWFFFNKNARHQNFLVVVASFFFYSCWDWRFLALIVASILIDYSIGVLLSKQKNHFKRKILLGISISSNLGLLAFFKYFNFFVENFVASFSFFGMNLDGPSLNIILPVGISFYTFQTLSYTFDIYKEKLKPTLDILSFAAFVSFFPQLVAGPIERASNFLPQFFKKRTFNYLHAVDGLRQILWGLFKKIVIANNCAVLANKIFANYNHLSGSSLLIGAVFFAFQIYGDFSGYSDIAIGSSRLFGLNLKENFKFPYFSRDIAEFWRRWHISLSSWFKSYLYIPLGGSRGSQLTTIRNVFLVFIVSGFWHGANWTFLFWGFFHAVLFIPYMLLNRNRKNLDVVAKGKLFPSLKELFSMICTFSFVTIAWIFFRSKSIGQAMNYISGIFSDSLFSFPDCSDLRGVFYTSCLIVLFLVIEWLGRENQYGIEKLGLKWPRISRYIMYMVIIISLFMLGGKDQQFIYFQF